MLFIKKNGSFIHTSDLKEKTSFPLSTFYLFSLNREPKVNLEEHHLQAQLLVFFLECLKIRDRLVLYVKYLSAKLFANSKNGPEVTIKLEVHLALCCGG